jgi:hypothetical protein
MTGLSRKAVSDLKDRSWKAEETLFSEESLILAEWVHDEAYLDHQGSPRDLAIGSGPGSFGSLVKDATGEDSHLRYLEKLCEVGCVQVNEDETVRMINRSFVIRNDLSRLLSGALAPLAKTIAHNWVRTDGGGLSQRVAFSASVDPIKAPALRRMSQARILNFIEEMDDVLANSEFDSPEIGEASDTGVFGVGAYYFEIENDLE